MTDFIRKLPRKFWGYKSLKHLLMHRTAILITSFLEILDCLIKILALTLYSPWWHMRWLCYITKKEMELLAKWGYYDEP